MHATMIAGLPGSGKSILAAELASAIPGCHLVDDPASPAALAAPPGTADLVACHPDFCRPGARAMAEQAVRQSCPDAAIRWIFFANDPDACLANARQRSDGRTVEGHVRRLSRLYVIPPGADVRAVYQPSPGPHP